MRFPLSLTTDMVGYMARKKLTGEKRFPLVLMLEPLHACNLTCTGCGRIREYSQHHQGEADRRGVPRLGGRGRRPDRQHLRRRADDLPGDRRAGPQASCKRRKHIYLCTNGMFIKKRLHEFRPTSRFFFNVHLDGLEETHDLAVERDGVFKAAVEGIKAAKKAGFLVCTNTTIYKETDLDEIDQLFAYLTKLGVDGFMLSPAYGYTAVQADQPGRGGRDLHDARRHPRQVQGGGEAAAASTA